MDGDGNANVSRFGGRIVGPGGFINISQNAKAVIFGGTFTAGKSSLSYGDGKLTIAQDGPSQKLVKAVEQITYSGKYGRERGQRTLYVTERAVFRLGPGGVELIEIAPGIDLQRDVLDRMGFKPLVSPSLVKMDARLFNPEKMNLARDLRARTPRRRSPRLDLPEAAQ
jgi:propionate CoA-transferase